MVEIPDQPRPSRLRCRSLPERGTCPSVLNYRERNVQWGRLVRAGYAKDEANRLMPLCRSCVTSLLKWESPALLSNESR